MKPQHHIIYIPGLNDQNTITKFFTKLFTLWWSFLGIQTHRYEPHWEDGRTVEEKLNKAMELANQLFDRGYLVSVIGQSAGGSLAFNLFARSEGKIIGAVNICGRLRAGVNVKPDLDTSSKFSPAFKQSVLLFETKLAPKLSDEQKSHMMTIRAIKDEAVPTSTTPLEGAQNSVFPMIGHMLAGGSICLFGANKMLDFLNSLEVESRPVDESEHEK